MSSREEFYFFVTCLRCGNQGELNVSEDDYPFMRNPNRAVEAVDGKFSAEVIDGRNVVVTCLVCDLSFEP